MIVSLIHGTTPKIKGRLRDICIESKFTRFYRKSTERQQKGNRTSTKSLKKLYKVYKKSTQRHRESTESLKNHTESLQKVFRKATGNLQKVYNKAYRNSTEYEINVAWCLIS